MEGCAPRALHAGAYPAGSIAARGPEGYRVCANVCWSGFNTVVLDLVLCIQGIELQQHLHVYNSTTRCYSFPCMDGERYCLIFTDPV